MTGLSFTARVHRGVCFPRFIQFLRKQGAGRLFFTARIERPLLYRGGSASKKNGLPAPSYHSESARCASGELWGPCLTLHRSSACRTRGVSAVNSLTRDPLPVKSSTFAVQSQARTPSLLMPSLLMLNCPFLDCCRHLRHTVLPCVSSLPSSSMRYLSRLASLLHKQFQTCNR